MKALLLIHGLRIGGAQVMVSSLVRHLQSSGHAVAIGCLDEVGAFGEELRAAGVSVELFNRRPGFDRTLPWRLARWLQRERFDVIHAHQRPAMFYGMLAACLRRLPLVYTEHGPLFGTPTRRTLAFNRILGRRARHITAVAEAVRHGLLTAEGFAGRAIEVIPNGVDSARFAPRLGDRDALRARFGLPQDVPLIGCIGRLDPVKNQAALLQALALLRGAVPSLGLVLVGEGADRQPLAALATQLGVGERVYWLGVQRRVEDVLAAIDVMCLPSRSEGIPLALLEAMSMEVPIVATAVGGIPEAVRDGIEATLVPLADAALLADALAAVLRDRARAAERAVAARRRVASAFSLAAVCERYERVLRAAATR